MPRLTSVLLALATLSATHILYAQSPDPAGQTTPPTQPAPAPIERPQYQAQRPAAVAMSLTAGQALVTGSNVATAQPAAGIFLRIAPGSSLTATTLTADTAEFRLERGLVNLSVHHPANSPAILIDLPGGQTSVLKDGLYTFNAATNTVRVLKGEAIAFAPNQKQIKVKEYHAVVLNAPAVRSVEFLPGQAQADLILYNPRPEGGGGYRGGYGYGYPGYGFGPYGDGFYGYGYPYYAWGYPYGGFGYPFGLGLGFGYYGGFGGFRGGYYGGFRGHR